MILFLLVLYVFFFFSTFVCVFVMYFVYEVNNNNNLGRRISINTGEARETSYLFQRISVLVQCFNAVLLHDSLPAADSTD